MSKSSKIASFLGMLMLVCLLGAAVSSSVKSDAAAPNPLAKFDVGVGSIIVVLDKASDAGKSQKNEFEVREIDGWHVHCHLSGRKDVPGRNRFVLNLEDAVFQVNRGIPKKKK